MLKIKAKADKLEKLLDELRAISAELTQAYTEFNRAVDPDMIESAVYAFNGLHSRYDFVLRQIKSLQNNPEETLSPHIPVYSKSRQLSIE